jgi:arsenate reductase
VAQAQDEAAPPLARRLAAEAVGTTLLAALVIGSGIAAQQLSPDDVGLQLAYNAAATAAGLYTIILMVGPVSGAHLNPVVSAADAVGGGLAWRQLAAYAPVQIAGCVAGAALANLMFARAAVSVSTKHRASAAHLLAEAVATAGLVLLVTALTRSGRGRRVPAAVGAYIGAAYWFTSSTSFANPAITVGRAFSDSFAGIAPASVPGFVAAQLAGGAAGLFLARLLYPTAYPTVAPEPARGVIATVRQPSAGNSNNAHRTPPRIQGGSVMTDSEHPEHPEHPDRAARAEHVETPEHAEHLEAAPSPAAAHDADLASLTVLGDLDLITRGTMRRSIDRIAYEFDTTFTRAEVEALFIDSYQQLARTAKIMIYLPILADRFARERLAAVATSRGLIPKRVPEVLFVCVRNAGRSQMAAAFARHYAGADLHIRTGGSDPGETIHPEVVASMKETGLSLEEEFPKPLTNDVVAASDVVVTMGCGDKCPYVPGKRYEDWPIDDPAGQPEDRVAAIRDDVDRRVRDLVASLLPDLAPPAGRTSHPG